MQHESAYKQLEKICKDCNKQNWNMTSWPVLLEAKRFLDLLDSKIESPFLSLEGDGGIRMDWKRGQDWLSVSVIPTGYLKWEWEIDGESGRNGRPFMERLPESLLDWLYLWQVEVTGGYWPSELITFQKEPKIPKR